jgi:hypothetical protein
MCFRQLFQDVNERVSHLARRAQEPCMIPVRPHRSAPTDDAIHRLRDAYRETSDSPLESRRRVRLDEQVDVIRLSAELAHAEARVAGGAERALDRGKDPIAPERGNTGPRPQSDVRRAVPLMRRATAMRDRATTGRRFSAGPGTLSAPRADGETELLLSWRHLDSGRHYYMLATMSS